MGQDGVIATAELSCHTLRTMVEKIFSHLQHNKGTFENFARVPAHLSLCIAANEVRKYRVGASPRQMSPIPDRFRTYMHQHPRRSFGFSEGCNGDTVRVLVR